MKRRRAGNAKPSASAEPDWNFRLYIAGSTPVSVAAFRNLQQICDEHLAGRYRIQVIDLVKNPRSAREDQIIAVPTVVRKRPLPIREVVGDLSNTERVLKTLDLRPRSPRICPRLRKSR